MVSAGVLFAADDEDLRTASLLAPAAVPEALLFTVEADLLSPLLCTEEEVLRASLFGLAL